MRFTDTTSYSLQPKAYPSLRLPDSDDFDPLDIFTRPPANESPADRQARELREQQAIERSRTIDTELRAAKTAMKQYKKAVKIILLGQSQSGEYFHSFNRHRKQ